jgi:hypothetical protein
MLEKKKLKIYFQMSKYILEGVIQKFDNKHNGRIYSESFFLNEIKRMRPKMRINKIKRIFNEK